LDASPDAFQVSVPLDLPDRQVHPDAKVRVPASARLVQAFPALDKSVSPASDWPEDASALPAAATAEVLQMLDSVDVAASNARPDPAAEALPASAPAAPPMGDFPKVQLTILVLVLLVPAHCSDAAQSALPAVVPSDAVLAASATLVRLLASDRTAKRSAAAAAWALSILGQDAVPPAMSVSAGRPVEPAGPDR